MSNTRFRVLLTNDDGPPSAESSPYIFGFWHYLTTELGWDVKVVIPSSQKSWIGKAYQIHDTIQGNYFYPKLPDGEGEVSETSRPLKEGELGEWVLLDGTPASCSNIALHNLYKDEIDLVLSGPNLGRNTSSAFALSSGTIGAALSAALSSTRAIALSYGTVGRAPPAELYLPAHALGASIIQHLLKNWGIDADGVRAGEIDIYNVNIPMVPGLLAEEGMPVLYTRIWRNTYGRLFKALPRTTDASPDVSAAGPGDAVTQGAGQKEVHEEEVGKLSFKFAPDMSGLIGSRLDTLPEGSDAWAMERGWASVTPVRASFAEPSAIDVFPEGASLQDRLIKL
ncbi:unnamed protein product [Peniophora sp. CBMAI 1063]|nr:unnamed protein product [Peniophora sp. CBMAI 1063]